MVHFHVLKNDIGIVLSHCYLLPIGELIYNPKESTVYHLSAIINTCITHHIGMQDFKAYIKMQHSVHIVCTLFCTSLHNVDFNANLKVRD